MRPRIAQAYSVERVFGHRVSWHCPIRSLGWSWQSQVDHGSHYSQEWVLERAVQRENSRDLQKVPFRYLANYWSDSCEKTLSKAEQRAMDNNSSLWCVWWLLSSSFLIAIDSPNYSPSSLSGSFSWGAMPLLRWLQAMFYLSKCMSTYHCVKNTQSCSFCRWKCSLF